MGGCAWRSLKCVTRLFQNIEFMSKNVKELMDVDGFKIVLLGAEHGQNWQQKQNNVCVWCFLLLLNDSLLIQWDIPKSTINRRPTSITDTVDSSMLRVHRWPAIPRTLKSRAIVWWKIGAITMPFHDVQKCLSHDMRKKKEISNVLEFQDQIPLNMFKPKITTTIKQGAALQSFTFFRCQPTACQI